jgi:hypothetical protein
VLRNLSEYPSDIAITKDIVTNMMIAVQRFSEHVPVVTIRREINKRCYEGRSLQTNWVEGAFPWQQTDNGQFPWLPLDYTRSHGEKYEWLSHGPEWIEWLIRARFEPSLEPESFDVSIEVPVLNWIDCLKCVLVGCVSEKFESSSYFALSCCLLLLISILKFRRPW